MVLCSLPVYTCCWRCPMNHVHPNIIWNCWTVSITSGSSWNWARSLYSSGKLFQNQSRRWFITASICVHMVSDKGASQCTHTHELWRLQCSWGGHSNSCLPLFHFEQQMNRLGLQWHCLVECSQLVAVVLSSLWWISVDCCVRKQEYWNDNTSTFSCSYVLSITVNNKTK